MKMSTNLKVKKIVFGNRINHVVAYWLLSFANLYLHDYDNSQEKRREVSESLSEQANPLQRHSLLEIIYLNLIALGFCVGAFGVLLGLLFPQGLFLNVYLIVLFALVTPLFILSGYFALRSWPVRLVESQWVNTKDKTGIVVMPKHDYLDIDYFIMVPVSIAASLWLSINLFG